MRTQGRRSARSAGDAMVKQAMRGMWALGDDHRFAKQTVWEVGPVLVSAAGIRPGQRVLDLSAGTGNTALRAAQAGADVVAADLTPENFEAGEREARALGVTIEWVEADAESLPFEDGEFDVVTSSFGVIFAPDHQAVADEMLRVCRPGGTIAMVNFRDTGVAARFFELVGRWAPPPPPDGARPPLLWGDEDYLRDLFGERLDALEVTPRTYVERAAGGPAEYRELFLTTFGPIIAIREGLAPDRRSAFERDLAEFAEQSNAGAPGEEAEYPYAYALVVARRRGVAS
ncbi:MAG TPA: methyltransferase domain-containing protein [Longimicrobiales bacterium]|nr:methyltransferase domain-containing protein [Longimicrobiales bacterium]